MTDPQPPDHDPAELQCVARELRGGLQPLLQALAGEPARPVRLTQGIGLDKSLASRLVKAVRSDGEDARVVRGGAWDLQADNCRATFRSNSKREQKSSNIGFRVGIYFP